MQRRQRLPRSAHPYFPIAGDILEGDTRGSVLDDVGRLLRLLLLRVFLAPWHRVIPIGAFHIVSAGILAEAGRSKATSPDATRIGARRGAGLGQRRGGESCAEQTEGPDNGSSSSIHAAKDRTPARPGSSRIAHELVTSAGNAPDQAPVTHSSCVLASRPPARLMRNG
jgi:hypothetical protein